MSKILLLDGEGVQVVCMARELNKLGHELTALCVQKVSSGYTTKYLHHKYVSPSVHLKAEAFKAYFYEHLKQHKYDLIIPMGDESAYFLSREKENVERQYRIICAVDFAIILVGMSKEDIKTKLPDGVIGIERTKSPEELSEFYSMADCVMSLSRLESFGLTPVEGFACGTPAIVYNCTSTPELITPETGFVAEVGNIEDIKRKVELIKERGKSYYSKRCREIALEKYDRNVCYHKYLSLYNSAINTKCE